ncbi:PD-(D/E)XK motif protein [Dehalococcoides mccartyi]|uniref:PD-(D/E)XK motif protein n=1 Tax=Dehalococcoides mccartyi TaxID=61435 RepID=UPI0002B76CBB|nr:PD-(D/E)XK motif protein [Dehalococcoides mccartyi]AGG05893.1 hypothetical protein dcmb_262 [Dehalococcoides mccartyi DCMB5]
MRITPELLEKQWNSIKYKDGGFLQIDTQHPLEWHIGYQSVSQQALLLVADTEIGSIESSKSMIVSYRKRESDNKWTLSFELVRNEQQSVFAILCCDIIEHSRPAANEKDALMLVINRYNQWSKLLESQRSGLMSEQSRKGLLGELLFLEKRIVDTKQLLESVQGWSGAESTDQDFMYSENWYEIKSIGASSVVVTISSLEQLDCTDQGNLVIMRIDKVAPKRSGAVSLFEVVQRLKDVLSADASATDLFQAKLMSYGYIDLHEYAEQKYVHTGTRLYRVDESFPKLIKKSVPYQVASANYELDIAALENWVKG